MDKENKANNENNIPNIKYLESKIHPFNETITQSSIYSTAFAGIAWLATLKLTHDANKANTAAIAAGSIGAVAGGYIGWNSGEMMTNAYKELVKTNEVLTKQNAGLKQYIVNEITHNNRVNNEQTVGLAAS